MNPNDDFALGFGLLVSLGRSDGRKWTHVHTRGHAQKSHLPQLLFQLDLKYRRKSRHSLLMATASLSTCSCAETAHFRGLANLWEYLTNPIPSKLKLLTIRPSHLQIVSVNCSEYKVLHARPLLPRSLDDNATYTTLEMTEGTLSYREMELQNE